jgi:hypothetical protein
MLPLFLSASIPDQARAPDYFASADPVAIRDAVRALATVTLPSATIYWGGHPAITPLIRVVAESMGLVDTLHVRLFQSAWFADQFPTENSAFQSVEITPAGTSLEDSLQTMRREMLTAAKFQVGVFIGGMNGVVEEFDLFRQIHPHADTLPVASTGGAALAIYERHHRELRLPSELRTDYSYASLFRRLIDLKS